MNASGSNSLYLKLGVLNFPLYSGITERFKNGTVLVDGAIDFVSKIVFALPGVRYEFYSPEKREMEQGFRQDNGSWTGMFGQLQRKELDVFMGPLITNGIYMDDFRIMNAYHYDNLAAYVSREGGRSISFFLFLKDVDNKIWFGLMVSFLVLIITSSFVDNSQNLKLVKKIARSVYNYVWIYLAALFLEGSEKIADTRTSQMLLFLWLFFVMILTNVITSQFRAVLTVRAESEILRNIKELSKREEMLPIIFDSFQPYLRESNIDYIHSLLRRAEEGGGVVPDSAGAIKGNLQKVKNGETAVFVFRETFKVVIQTFCLELDGNRKIYYIEENLNTISLSFLLYQDFPDYLEKRLNQRARTYIENGFAKYFLETLTRNYWKCLVDNEDYDPDLELKHLLPVFYLHLQTQALCCITFVVEIFVYRMTKDDRG